MDNVSRVIRPVKVDEVGDLHVFVNLDDNVLGGWVGPSGRVTDFCSDESNIGSDGDLHLWAGGWGEVVCNDV